MRSIVHLFKAPLVVLLISAVSIRGFYLIEATQLPNFLVPYAGLDADMYRQLAQRIVNGDLLLKPHPYYFSALYAYFLGGLNLPFGTDPWVPRLANMVMGFLTVVCIFYYSRSFFRSKRIAYLAAFLAAIYGPFVVFDTSALKTSLGLFLVSMSLLLLSSLKNRASFLIWLSIGLFLGLASNLSGQVSTFILTLIIGLIVSMGTARFSSLLPKGQYFTNRPLKKLLGFGLGLCLAVSPFALRNYVVTGEPIFGNCTSGLHFYIGNQTKAWGGYTRVPGIRPNPAGHYFDAKKIAEKDVGHPLKDSEASNYWKKCAWEEIRSHPNSFLNLLGKKLLLIVNPYEIPNNENYQFLRKRSIILPYLPAAGLILPLCFAGWLLAIWQRRGPLVLHLYIGSYMIALLFSIVTWRYRLPLLLGLLPFGALLIFEIASKIKDGKRVHVLMIAFLVAACWAAGHFHPVAAESGPSDMRQAGLKMSRCQEMADLQNRLRIENDMSARKRAYTWLQIARLHHRQKDIEGALNVLQTAMIKFPHHSGLQRFYRELWLKTTSTRDKPLQTIPL